MSEKRFGFNGKENDREWGGQLIQDYGFRLYNPAIGKFLSVDPLSSSYPWNSTYAFAENDVIRCIDLDGLEKYFSNTGEFLGSINDIVNGKLSETSSEIRVMSDKAVKEYLKYSGMARLGYLEQLSKTSYKLLTETSNETQSNVLTTMYNKNTSPSNEKNGMEYDLGVGRVTVHGVGTEELEDDNGGKKYLGYVGAASSYYSKKTNTGYININDVSDNYWEMSTAIDHENNHNLQSKKGMNTVDGLNHFDVEWNAYSKYKHVLNEGAISYTKDLLTSFIREAAWKLHDIKNTSGIESKEYREYYNGYMDRVKKFDREFNKKE